MVITPVLGKTTPQKSSQIGVKLVLERRGAWTAGRDVGGDKRVAPDSELVVDQPDGTSD